jgi:hypothetical protein
VISGSPANAASAAGTLETLPELLRIHRGDAEQMSKL